MAPVDPTDATWAQRDLKTQIECRVANALRSRVALQASPNDNQGVVIVMALSIDELTEEIAAVSGATNLDPDRPIAELSDVDSMDMMEWLYNFQSQNPSSGVGPELFENPDGLLTLRDVHSRILTALTAA